MNKDANIELDVQDQKLIQKFLKDTTLFLGPDPEIMRDHRVMPRTETEERCMDEYTDLNQIASIRDRLQSACEEGFEMVEQMGAAPGAKWGDIITGIYSA